MLPQVKLSKRAEIKLESLFNYLETKWSSRVKNNFINKLEKAIRQIQQHPEGFPKSDIIKGLHKHVITRQTTIYYKFDKKYIYIVTVFDSRRNPKKLVEESKE